MPCSSWASTRSVDVIHRDIDFVNEYRTRLIADVVTGNLDVREVVARLPEMDPLVAKDDLVDGVDHDAGSERKGCWYGAEQGGSVADVVDTERSEAGEWVG